MKKYSAVVFLSLVVMSGCSMKASKIDPLGSAAKNVDGEADFSVDGLVICRELEGDLDTSVSKARAAGFRCIESGQVKGCVKFDDGRVKYISEACDQE